MVRLEHFNEGIGRAISWLTLAMVLITFVVVVLRYFFSIGWIAMQETVTYLHACVFMLGAAYTLRADAHVRVDIFYQKFSQHGRDWVDLLGTLLLLFPVSLFIAWVSVDYVWVSWRVLEGSPESGGLPGVFLLKTLIPLFAILLILQGTVIVFKKAAALRGRR